MDFDSSDFSQTGRRIPCKYFSKGSCLKGGECSFLHLPPANVTIQKQAASSSSSQNQVADMQIEDHRGDICKFFLQGRCTRGTRCKFRHESPSAPLPPANGTQKQSHETGVPILNSSETENETSRTKGPSLLEVIENEKKSPQKVRVGLNHFEILAQIGDGYVGRVYQVRMKQNNNIYAMKIIPKQKVLESSLIYSVLTERNIMMGLDHPFIIKLHYAFQTSGSLHLIMDFLPGGDLSFHLNNLYCFPEDRARFYAAEIALALQYLHDQNIIYRDLKAANTLLDIEGHIRLADFGMSKLLETSERTTNSFSGTTRYMAPEVINNTNYGIPIDWWSFGILLFLMLTGQFPFDGEEDVIPSKILSDRLNLPNNISPAAKSLLRGLLERNPKTRLKGSQVTQHSFFSSINWKKLYKLEINPAWKPYLENGLRDLSNFPSDLTSEELNPSQVNIRGDNSFMYQIDSFSYCSPSIQSVVLQAMKDNGLVDENYTLNWEKEEGDEEEENEEMADVIPEDGCFVLTI